MNIWQSWLSMYAVCLNSGRTIFCKWTCRLDWNWPARVVNIWFVPMNGLTSGDNIRSCINETVPPLSNKAVKTLWLGMFCINLGINIDIGSKSCRIVSKHSVWFVCISIFIMKLSTSWIHSISNTNAVLFLSSICLFEISSCECCNVNRLKWWIYKLIHGVAKFEICIASVADSQQCISSR